MTAFKSVESWMKFEAIQNQPIQQDEMSFKFNK